MRLEGSGANPQIIVLCDSFVPLLQAWHNLEGILPLIFKLGVHLLLFEVVGIFLF